MGSTAIQIIAQAFRANNLTEPTSFAAGQEFPVNIALDVLNKVIREMNRLGNLWFTEASKQLVFSGGSNTYDLSAATYLVDPKRIRYIRKELTNHQQELREYNKRDFLQRFRSSTVSTAEPTAFTKYGNVLELDTIPDQNYQVTVYHFQDMPLVVNTTDTFLIPERDEDILIDSCTALLKARTGQLDEGSALQLIRANTMPFLVQVKTDAGMPKQMPAAF
jgi:hypothetical protein